MTLKSKDQKEMLTKKKDNTLLYGLGVMILIIIIILIIRSGNDTPKAVATYSHVNYENCLLVTFEPKPVVEPERIACDNENCCSFTFSSSVCQTATCYKR